MLPIFPILKQGALVILPGYIILSNLMRKLIYDKEIKLSFINLNNLKKN